MKNSKKKFTKEEFTTTLIKELKFHVVIEGKVIALESRLEEDLDMDSLEIIEVFLDLEDKYKGIKIDNRYMDIKKMKTVENLRDFIWDNLAFSKSSVPENPEIKK